LLVCIIIRSTCSVVVLSLFLFGHGKPNFFVRCIELCLLQAINKVWFSETFGFFALHHKILSFLQLGNLEVIDHLTWNFKSVALRPVTRWSEEFSERGPKFLNNVQ